MPAPKNLTLDQWLNSVQAGLDLRPCPRCGAEGDAWVDDGLLVFDSDCGSRAEVVLAESEHLKSAYQQLLASCPDPAPLGDRLRTWRYAE